MKIADIQTGAKISQSRGKLAIAIIVLNLISCSGIFILLWFLWSKNFGMYNAWFETYNKVNFILWIISGITFSMWLYRAYSNLKLMGIAKTKYDPTMAVLGVWVIFANFYIPFVVMKEMDALSAEKNNSKPNSLSIVMWWVPLLLFIPINWMAIISFGGNLTNFTIAHSVAYALFLCSGIFLIKLIRLINDHQIHFARN
jgi:hypothetical protein